MGRWAYRPVMTMETPRHRVHISIPARDWDLIRVEAARRNITRSGLLLDLAAPGIAAIRRRDRVQRLLHPGGAA